MAETISPMPNCPDSVDSIVVKTTKPISCSSQDSVPFVLDLVSQVRDVVLVMYIFSSGEPQGVGILERGVYEDGMEMGRSVYEQPGTKVVRILSHQGGFQVSKGKRKGTKEE